MGILQSLPNELLDAVLDRLAFCEALHLSSTCQTLRQLLVPRIFTAVRIPCKTEQAESALAAVSRYGIHVKCIRFVGTAEVEDIKTSPALPLAARKLLSGHGMPNLRCVSMGFDFDLGSGQWVDRDESGVFCGNHIFEHAEDEEEVREAEEIHQWRDLMNDAWRALAGNMLVTELIIEQFLPKWVSYFRTDEFCQFLSRLHSVTMSIYGESDGAGWGSNRVEGYNEAIEEISDVLFRNMKNVTTLTLIASRYGAFGSSDSIQSVQLPLKSTHLPELQELYLGNAFLDDDVLDFIRQRSQTIRHLDLSGCMADAYSCEGLGTWSSLFSQLQTMELPKLVSFSAGGGIMPYPRAFWEQDGPVSWGGVAIAYDWVDDLADSDTAYRESDNEWTNDRRKLWRYIKSNSKIQPFQYCLLDEECGYISVCASTTLESMQNGRDRIAYESLLKHVHQNKMRMINEASGR